MCMCNKCKGLMGILLLVAGILYLLTDYGVMVWWKLNWWTFVFLLVGLGAFFSSGCPECKKLNKKK